MNKEEKHIEIREKLRNLEPVKAGDNFVHTLNSRIIEIEAEKRKVHEKKYDGGKGGFLKNLFGNMQYPWLVPAAGFTILIFFVFYITFLSKNASENIPQISTDKKQEITEQKSAPSENNLSKEKEPAATTDSGKTLNGNEIPPGKNIAGDIKPETNLDQSSPLENNTRYSDKDEVKTYRQELKAATPELNDGLSSNTSDDKIDLTKDNSETSNTENNGMISTEKNEAVAPETKKSSVINESPASLEQKENPKSKRSGKDSVKSTLNEKLIKINGESLEKIREEINK